MRPRHFARSLQLTVRPSRRTVAVGAVAALCCLATAGWWRTSLRDRTAHHASAAGLPRTPLVLPLRNPRIEISKGERVLRLSSGGGLVRTYPIGLGRVPVGDKVREGDGRTPEGRFTICEKNPRSQFTLSLRISYPNEEDAERGLRDRLITRSQYRRIVRDSRAGRTPPQDTVLGSDIFLHGRGSGSDWTLGCVALDDPDIEELYRATPVGTPVTITP